MCFGGHVLLVVDFAYRGSRLWMERRRLLLCFHAICPAILTTRCPVLPLASSEGGRHEYDGRDEHSIRVVWA